MLCTPCTTAHLSGVNQASKTPAHTGKIGPCAAPSTNCTPRSAANSPAPPSTQGSSGVASVAAKATEADE